MRAISNLLSDLRHAARIMARTRTTTVIVVATLGVGTAVVTSFFSFVNSAALRPLPYPDAARLVALSEESRNFSPRYSAISLDAINALRRGTQSFERLGAFRERLVTLSGTGDAVALNATEVDDNVLPLLRVQPQRGRLLTGEDVHNKARVAMLSDRLWRARFGSSDDVIGRTVRIGGVSHIICGVLPAGVLFYERSDLIVPLIDPPGTAAAGEQRYSLVGRLRSRVTLTTARTEVNLVGRRLALANPARHGEWSIVVREELVDRGVQKWAPFAAFFLGAATFVLLIASLNVAMLLLARAATRRGEMTLRASMGATRSRLLWQNMTESAALAMLAGAVGLLLSVWGVHLIAGLVPLDGLPGWVRIGVDQRVAAFGCLLSLLTVLAFGLLPALDASRVNLAGWLKGNADSTVTRSGAVRRCQVLIVAELALSLVLFVGAALMVRSYHNLATMDPGYEPARVLSIHVDLNASRYPDAELRGRFYAALSAAVRRHPGAETAAFEATYARLRGTVARMDSAAWLDTDVYLPGTKLSVTRGLLPTLQRSVVSDAYFRVLGLPLLRGRGFDSGDREGTQPVVAVSESLARLLWPDADAVGRQLRLGRDGPLLTVVGVVGDRQLPIIGRSRAMGARVPELYFSERQAEGWFEHLLVRTRGAQKTLRAFIASNVRALDADQPLWEIRTLAEELERGTVAIRLAARILGAFALAALLLAAIGIYGVVAYSVEQRRPELGIRMALGAAERDVVLAVVRRGAMLVATGLSIGLLGALLLTRALTAFLFNVSPVEPLTYEVATVLFGGVALLATYLPARRATTADPAAVLRRV